MWIGQYFFEGPFFNLSQINDLGGLYAIVDANGNIIDIGQSGQLRTRLMNHDRIPCWKKQTNGSYRVYIFYTPNFSEAERMMLEKRLRYVNDPPCGDR
ncbi:MAG: hypothetical protein HBSAPP04_00360 [Ignavibacteriaceae bacterium]|nr:MAG: hypothetical protein HBSAPP04_00360 [Ignavibacteriaceae bacterium]